MARESKQVLGEEHDQSFSIYTAVPLATPEEPEGTNDGPQYLESILESCKSYSWMTGIIIGCLIQLSSMGAFFLYVLATEYKKNGQADRALDDMSLTKNQVVFCLIWSAVTSGLGVLLLVLMASLFQQMQSKKNGVFEETFTVSMECYVTAGAVSGACLAWTIKAFLLGDNVMSWQTLVVVGVALLYSHLAKMILHKTRNIDEEEDLSVPLLEEADKEEEDVSPNYENIRVASLVFGLVVGCMIQMSSIGANYVITHVAFEQGFQSIDQIPKGHILTVTTVWSCFTSALGVAMFILVRRLLELSWDAYDLDDNNRISEDIKITALSNLEIFFATGAFIGVNVSWIVTDWLVGFDSSVALMLWRWIVS